MVGLPSASRVGHVRRPRGADDPPRILSPHGDPDSDKCRSPCARHYRCPMRDVVRGLRQALLWLVASAAVALVAAGVWFAVQGGGFRPKVGVALVAIALFLSLTGGTVLSRAATVEMRALYGMGSDIERPASGDGLTTLGVFVFVALPLLVVGGLLLGRG